MPLTDQGFNVGPVGLLLMLLLQLALAAPVSRLHKSASAATRLARSSTAFNERQAFLYNSSQARAASSFLYEFGTIGLQSADYKIETIGHADSQPMCADLRPACEHLNPRTTLRLRIDTRSLETRLQQR